jgi:streptogramin lyase
MRIMFSRLVPLASIRASLGHQPYQDNRRNRALRHAAGHRSSAHARFRLENLEDRCLLSGISGITEFPAPVTQVSRDGITAGSDGNIWFTEYGADAIGTINLATDTISSFTVPTANASPYGITAGPDDNLWFTELGANKIGEINPTTHAISEFATPTANSGPLAITAGPDGNLWFSEQRARQIGEINPTTHAISEFALSIGSAIGGYGITAGPDGNIWFTEQGLNKIGRINPTTDVVTWFALPSGVISPEGITAGPDGNVWFTAYSAGDIGMINPTTDAIITFSTPSANAEASGITAGPDGNLWFTESGAGKIASINPTTDAITEYPIPYTGSTPTGITTGPDSNLWFADYGTAAVGVATLASSQLVVTQEPPASVTAGSGFGLTVTAEDSSGNVITSFNGTVTVAIATNPGGATMGGTLTATASSGVATFSGLTLNKATAGYTLEASASGLAAGVTSAITVTPEAATQLVITTEPPATVKVNTGFGFQASIEDQYGNVVTTATNTVSVAFANNPTGATLGGTLRVTASQGVATFSGLKINKTGNGYTLQVSSSGLSSAVTNAINVTKTGMASIVVGSSSSGINAPDPLLAPLVLDSPDLWNSLGFKKRSRSV